MKILVLMPCDEKTVYDAQALLNNIPKPLRENTFSIPSFMEYVIRVGLAKNWVGALYYAMIAAKNIYLSTKPEDDLIIIGNLSTDYKFDKIFRYTGAEDLKDYPFQDLFMDKVRSISTDEPVLMKLIGHVYGEDDYNFSLFNAAASAAFLNDYIATDFNVEEANKRLQVKLDAIMEHQGGQINASHH